MTKNILVANWIVAACYLAASGSNGRAAGCPGSSCAPAEIGFISIDEAIGLEFPDAPAASSVFVTCNGVKLPNNQTLANGLYRYTVVDAKLQVPRGRAFHLSFQAPSEWTDDDTGDAEFHFGCGVDEIEVDGFSLHAHPGRPGQQKFRYIQGVYVELESNGCGTRLYFGGSGQSTSTQLFQKSFLIEIPGEESCDSPAKPSVSDDGRYRTSMSSGLDEDGAAAGLIHWDSPEASSAVDPAAWSFSGADLGLDGVSDVTVGDTRQIKTATLLTDMTRSGDVLVVGKYGLDGLGSPDGNGLYPLAGLALQEQATYEVEEELDPGTSEIISSCMLVTVVRGEETMVWHELEFDAAAGLRRETDHLAGTRSSVIAGETAGGQRTETRESYRHSASQGSYVLISKVTDVFEDDRLVESIVDPGGAHLVTAYGYDLDSGARTIERYPDGSWSSRSKAGYFDTEEGWAYGLIAADGLPDTNDFPGVTGEIVSANYRPWLDSTLPASGVPDATLCVADLEIGMSVGVDWVTRRETRTQGEISSRVDTWSGADSENGTWFAVDYTRTWNSGAGNDHATTAIWTHTAGDWTGRVYKSVGGDGLVRRFDYKVGTYTPLDGFCVSTGGAFLRTREWDTAELADQSTRSVRIEAEDGRTVEQQLEVWTGSGWATMSTDRWQYDDGHEAGKLTEHFKDGILVGRTVVTLTAGTEQSADGPAVVTLMNGEGELISLTEDYPGDTPDIVTTYSRDGRKEIVTRTAGGLVQTTVSESDVAGRTVSMTDERGITHTSGYSDGGRTVTVTRPGGISETSTSYLDGRQKSVSGTGAVAMHWSYAVDNGGFVSTTTYTGSADASSPRWSTAVSDWSGRPIASSRPNPAGSGTVGESRHFDASTGRLIKITSTGQADRLFSYNALGRMVLSGLDLGASPDGELVLASADRITRTVRDYVEIDNRWWERSVTSVFPTVDDGDAAYVTEHRRAVAPVNHGGAARWTNVSIQPGGHTVTTHRDEYLETATTVEATDSSATTASPDGTATTVAGRLTSITEYGAAQATTFGYDALGRQVLLTDPRGGTSRTIYDAAGQATYLIDHARNATVIDYYPADHMSAGLQRRVSNPELESTEYTYDALGRVATVGGNGTYPLSYAYDIYGGLHTLTTYSSGGAGDTTTWIRDPATGVLQEKRYADGKGTAYTYYPSGRVHTRTWERGASTTYTYAPAGELTGIDYSDATPDVTLVPDRLGRPHEITDGGGTMTRSYHPDLGAETTDAYDPSHAWLPGVTVDRGWTPATAQRLHTGARRGSTWDQKADILHDPVTGRLEKITGPGFAHRYGYAPGTNLITGVTHRNTADTQTIAWEIRRRDLAGRLYGIETQDGTGAVLQRHGYRHDKAGRRIRATREDGSHWAYGYNDRGEVVSGKKLLSDGTPLAGQQFEYDYDALGNRNWAKFGGDQNGENLRSITYESNILNQYTRIETPGSLDVIGRAPVTDTVTVNGQATLRQGDRFRAEIAADNSGTAVWQDIEVANGTPPDIEGSRYLPKATVLPTHDDDGNLLFDGRWDYVWDAENRLASMTTNATAQANGEPYCRLAFGYDWMGRRIRKQVFDSPAATTPAEDLRFAYDDWNLIAEYTATGGLALLRGYTWGTDLSGTEQGAGGVGGLLSVRSGTFNYAAGYDGNGNIVGWMSTSGELAARQEYDPFGNRIIQVGGLDLPIVSSTKYQDRETDLLYYGYRYYYASAGMWRSRDPMGEYGGGNLYGFVGNRPVQTYDYLGLKPGDPFKTWELALNDSRKHLRIEGGKSVEKGWAQFSKRAGIGKKDVYGDVDEWKSLIVGEVLSDYGAYKKGVISGKATFHLIMGREVASSVYCFRDAKKEIWYSYNYYPGSMIPAKEYDKIMGRVPLNEALKLIRQKNMGISISLVTNISFILI